MTVYHAISHVFQLRCEVVVLQYVVNQDICFLFAVSCKNGVISPWSLGYMPVLINTLCLHNSRCSFRWIVEFSSLPVINYSVVLLCTVQQLQYCTATVQCFSPNFWPFLFNHFFFSVEFVSVFQTARIKARYKSLSYHFPIASLISAWQPTNGLSKIKKIFEGNSINFKCLASSLILTQFW